MKKIMLFFIFALLSIPMTSSPMARFATSKLGKSALASITALGASKLSSLVGNAGSEDIEEYLPKVPTHPSYPYDQEGTALEHLCLQAPSVNAEEFDSAKKRKARKLADKVHGMLPGSEAHRKEKYPFETGDGSLFYLMPGCWSKDYQYPMRKYNNRWWEKKPLKPEEIYETQIPGEKQIDEVRATIQKLSAQSFKPTRQSYEESLKKYTVALEQEKNKHFWEYDRHKIHSLEWNIEYTQKRIKECSILGSTHEEIALLQAASFIRKDFLEKHLINHSEWEKQKNKIEKQREEMKKQRKEEISDTWSWSTH